jgi:hypothetical protein
MAVCGPKLATIMIGARKLGPARRRSPARGQPPGVDPAVFHPAYQVDAQRLRRVAVRALADRQPDLGLPPGSATLDIGAREGHRCIELGSPVQSPASPPGSALTTASPSSFPAQMPAPT